MTSDLTRRTALGFFTIAGIAAVSGCSNSIFSSTSVKTHTPSSSDSSEPATTSSEASPSSSSASSTSASPSSSSSSSSSSSDYSSEAKIDKYDTSAGNFESATKEHPARNVPKPVKPEKMSENSTEGLKAALGYLSAALKPSFCVRYVCRKTHCRSMKAKVRPSGRNEAGTVLPM